MSHSLLDRARSLLPSCAPAMLALAIVPLAGVTPAAAVSNSDLQVQYSGAYFYNSSGFFSDWATAPADGAQNTTNVGGSATATSDDFYAHNMRRDGAGDMLNIHYDFSADVAAPGAGASHYLSAYLGAYQPSNVVGSALVGGWTDSRSGALVGDMMSQPLNEWDIVDRASYC